MPATTPHFSPKALTFFRQLERNNAREWFQPRKAEFEEIVRKPMIELVALINDDLRGFAVDNVVKDPAKALYRIYRDTRFSKDKTPYKTHIGAIFPRKGLGKHAGAGYYVGISHKCVEIAGGMYMPGDEELRPVRAAILKDEKAFRRLVGDPKKLKLTGPLRGEQSKRVPKAYAADSPVADLLRYKQFYFGVELPAETALKPSLRKTVVHRFRAMSPLVEYLNEAALAALAPEDEARPVRPAPMF